jgi:1-acyl-sn-glycerol-3-phosphate acyltransferase
MKPGCSAMDRPRPVRPVRAGHARVERSAFLFVLQSFLAVLIRIALRVYVRFEMIGEQNLRTNRSLIMVANHCSHLDTVCLLAALPLRKLRCAFAAAASDYFFQSVARTWVAALVCNAFPFQRDLRARHSLSLCAELLDQPGTILIIFPEGTRSTTGAVHAFKSGIGALVAGRDLNVVPCYLRGSFRVWPKGTRLPRPGKVQLVVGEARNYRTRSDSRDEIVAIARELQEAVIALGNEKR